MVVLTILKRIVGKMDLFSSIQLLRFDGDAETKTFTGGVFSLSIIIYLIATFSSMVFDTFNKLIITSTSDSKQDNEPEPIYLLTSQSYSSHFMLGVQVWHFDLNTGPRYFDVTLSNSFMADGIPGNDSISYIMQPCSKQHWQSLPNASQIYDKVQMHKWLCIPLNIAPVLMGKYYSNLQTTLDIKISKCNNDTDPSRPCAPQAEIDDYLYNNGPIYFTPFFINPLINPQNKEYFKLYLQDKYYIMFGHDYGMEMYVYNAGYQITTDESILPFTTQHVQNGSIVTSVSTNAYSMGNSTDVYGFISFFRDPSTIIITRTYQKIIDAFSFVGGLLGSFLLILIFVNFYNECSYEMRFASLYKTEKDSPTNAKKFNLFYYLLQSIYTLLTIVKIKCENWRVVRYFHKTREEMVRQLDVRYLFKKLHILQNAMMVLLTKPQLKGLMLQHQMTISEAKRTRRIYGLKSRVKKLLKEKLRKSEEEAVSNKKEENNFKTTTEMFANDNSIANENNYVTQLRGISSPENAKPPFLRKETIQYLNSSESGESSDSSDGDESSENTEQKLIEDLRQLREQSVKNEKSATILKNLDPFIKSYYQENSIQRIQHQQMQSQERKPNNLIKQGPQFEEISVHEKEQVTNIKNSVKLNQLPMFTYID